MANSAAKAVRMASGLVAQAITELISIGPEAPIAVREALTCLGQSFTQLGYIDPSAEWGVEEDASEETGNEAA